MSKEEVIQQKMITALKIATKARSEAELGNHSTSGVAIAVLAVKIYDEIKDLPE